jgi:putative nucleotidyltransferase with HDIG domain
MPQAAVKLRSLFKEDYVPIVDITNILRQDPGLSANVLRLANSAHFGVSSKVGSLKQAVMLLGVKRFEQITISACMNKTMDKTVEGYNLSPGELWLHSIAVSTTAEALAKFIKIADTNDVFAPALLHDMGKLILGKFVKNEKKPIESLVANGYSMVEAEYKILGTDHAEIGALILGKWSFPDEIINAVRWHHDPDRISKTGKRLKETSLQSDIVYLSNSILQSNGNSESGGDERNMPSSEVLNRLGIKADQYQRMVEKAHNWKNQLADTLTFV